MSLPSGLRTAGAFAGLAVLLAASLIVVIIAASGPSGLVWGSGRWPAFPTWLAGPFHGLTGEWTRHRHLLNKHVIGRVFSGLILGMTLAYFLTLACFRSLRMRWIAAFCVAAVAILVLGPPLQLSDLFNYLGYSRLWAAHGLNPYTHVIRDEVSDPLYHYVSWRNWNSPYGTLFTALTYPLGLMSFAAAYWTLKVVTALLALGFLWLVWKCARLLGRDPRLPVLIVAANPIFLIYAVGEFHNDFFMLVPSMAAIALVLTGRYRWAGAALAVAIAVKLTVILLLPFLLVAAWRERATLRMLSGLVLAGLPLAVMSVALFGWTLPNVTGQSRLLTGFSAPNLLGWALGLGGGTPQLLRYMNLLVVAVVLYQILRSRDWLSGAGWATLALLLSLGWLMPWYVLWLLPLAALAPNLKLRSVALLTSVFLIVSFMPVTNLVLSRLEINPNAGPVGLSAWRYQWISQFGRPGVAYAFPNRYGRTVPRLRAASAPVVHVHVRDRDVRQS